MVSSKHPEKRIRELEHENARLKRAVDELSVLNDLAREIGASSNLDEILRTIVNRSLRAVDGEQGVITLVDEDRANPTETLVRTIQSNADQRPYRPDQNLIGWMHHHRTPLRVNDPANDRRVQTASFDTAIHSILCVPLMVRSRLIGILTVYNKKGELAFTDDDQRLLTIIAGQSAQVIENARLYEEEKELLLMQEEIRVARDIQTRLLPDEPPGIPGYEIAGRSIPAQKVGGDYFDYIAIDGHRTGFCLGDASGKGLPASLLMANLQATLRGQALSTTSVSQCINRSNELICESVSSGRFVTLFYGVLDASDDTFEYVNAGHNPPMLWTDDSPGPDRLEAGGLILGVFPGTQYEEQSVDLHPGDQLVMYSDGITEAANEKGEQYGETRLKNCISAHRSRPADQQLEEILTSVENFAGAASQSDDITLLVMKRIS